MSHITTITHVDIVDLEALKLAAADCGLEFREGQRTHKWYGHWVGDYPLPKGVTVNDLGKCDHALSVPGDARAYEIGVAQVDDKWQLRYDFWNGGYGLEKKVGKNAERLVQRYSYHAAIRTAEEHGLSLANEYVDEEGNIKLEFEPQQFAAQWS